MSTGSWLVVSIAKLGAFIMVISGVSSDINEWLLACTGTDDEFGTNSTILRSELVGGIAPIPKGHGKCCYILLQNFAVN